ncbi:glutamine--fructose-6-phosphate transaminase (isomerizing) [Candidatus Parcubacteria bacterium]|nr:MAG: glutamine--fructose-6-phosphate transaminase (isomerizing) [Candidatus Parcubacteria bacterium]
MCGIVGYAGSGGARKVLLEGLERLEYRGYDSAGMLVWDGMRKHVVKAVGRVAVLKKKAAGCAEGMTGIAHTRWATHGAVLQKNTHPHSDCAGNIYVVHNGVIENEKELRTQLVKRGHRFSSDTDSEIFAHLIEEASKWIGPLEEAVRRAIRQVRGAYGLVAWSREEPLKLVAARHFSPLVIGMGGEGNMLASDVAALAGKSKKVLYLKDGEIAVVTKDNCRVIAGDKGEVAREGKKIEWDAAMATKGKFPTFMLKEIYEQPEVLANSLRGRVQSRGGKVQLGGLRELVPQLKRARRVFLCGMGTAFFAALVGSYILEEYAAIPAFAELASEFHARRRVLRKDDVFIAVSQSGETADTLKALLFAKKAGMTTLGIVNAVGSTISRETQGGVYQRVGPEIGVASTKAFTSQVALLVVMALFLREVRGGDKEDTRRLARALLRLPSLLATTLHAAPKIERIAKKYAKGFPHFLFLGRGYQYPVALEGALKLKEVAYVHAEGMNAAAVKHGPLAMLGKKFPAIVLAPRDALYEKNITTIKELRARNTPVIAIATKGDRKIAAIADEVLTIPAAPDALLPVISVIPLQLFAYHMGVRRGNDVDKPRNLAKSVTVE